MKRFFQTAVMAVLGAMLFAGCSKPPVLDATNEQTLQTTMAEMEKTLSPSEVEELREAVKLIRQRETAIWKKKGVGKDAPELGRVCLSGLNAKQVIQFAKDGKLPDNL